jgi:adenosylhomocysteine nucleosidase
MHRELRPLVRARSMAPVHIDGVRAWRAADVLAAVVGVGPAAARHGTALVLDASGAERVLVVGVAGAVVPWLSVGDVLVPEAVVGPSGAWLRPHGPAADGASGASRSHGGREGILATVSVLGASVPDEAWAVDMETAAVAEECERRGIPWDVRRAISDVPGTLDAGAAALVRPDGRTNGWAVARLLARRPLAAATLARLGRDSALAVRAATRATLGELVEIGCHPG